MTQDQYKLPDVEESSAKFQLLVEQELLSIKFLFYFLTQPARNILPLYSE